MTLCYKPESLLSSCHAQKVLLMSLPLHFSSGVAHNSIMASQNLPQFCLEGLTQAHSLVPDH